MVKRLVLYVFHEINRNVEFFIKHGIINDPDIEYIFIQNGLAVDFNRWNFLGPNVRLFIRPNVGHDFQGWNDALFLPASELNNKIIHHSKIKKTITSFEDREDYVHSLFDQIIFINSTSYGPVLPYYVKENWVECFTSKLSIDDVKMVGISVNFIRGYNHPHMASCIKQYYGIEPRDQAHIQSMCYALDREGLDILLKYKLFSPKKQFTANKQELIYSAEIAMSTILRHEKKSLFSYLPGQGLIKHNVICNRDNVWWHERHIPKPICNTIFIKIVHGVYPDELSLFP